MSLEEEHRAMHRRGEMIKFLLLLLVLVGAVVAIALLRPLIFERIVPAVLGLDQEPMATPLPQSTALPTVEAEREEDAPRIMTATPPAVETQGEEPTTGEAEGEAAPAPTSQVYEIQQGDTLVEIAERFGVTVQANSIANPNRIQPGQTLVIPAP